MEKFCKDLRDQEMKIKSHMKNKNIIIYATKDFVQMKIRHEHAKTCKDIQRP